MIDMVAIEAGWRIQAKLWKIYVLPKDQQQEHITIGILAGDWTQEDVDEVFGRWDTMKESGDFS